MQPTERDLSDRFERRYAAIDAEIPSTPAFGLVRPRTTAGLRRPAIAVFAALVVVAIAVPMLGIPWAVLAPSASGAASPDASGEPDWTPRAIPDAKFPAQATGLTVITASTAADLLRAGKLDGRAVAVAGYYDAFYPSCPATSRYVGPLERFCSFSAFADTPDAARLCQDVPNGRSCHGPLPGSLSPFFMPETSGNLSTIFAGFDTADPLPMILIGHGGDPRQFRCTAATQDACAREFVVDRIAWALGQEIPLTRAEMVDPWTSTSLSLTPSMSVDQVAAATGLADGVVTASAFRAQDLANIDPRLILGSRNLVWLVRGVDGQADGDGSAPETLWLIDDTTGAVIGHQPLSVDASFEPARVWQQATVHGYECCPGDVSPNVRVTAPGGDTLFEGYVPGGARGGTGLTIFGGGYDSTPLVLPAGEYSITAWLGTYGAGIAGRHEQECSGRVRVGALQSVTIELDFPVGTSCSIETGPPPTSEP